MLTVARSAVGILPATNPSSLAAISVSIAPVYKVRGPSRTRIHQWIQYRCPSATEGHERANTDNDDSQDNNDNDNGGRDPGGGGGATFL